MLKKFNFNNFQKNNIRYFFCKTLNLRKYLNKQSDVDNSQLNVLVYNTVCLQYFPYNSDGFIEVAITNSIAIAIKR